MLMMMGPKKGQIGEAIVEKFVNGKKTETIDPNGYSDTAKLAAQELIDAVESKDPNRVISAFLALGNETRE